MSDRQQRIDAVGFDFYSQPRQHHLSCPMCDGATLTTIVQRDRYGYPSRSDLCRQCGVVFLNPVMTTKAYSRFYGGVYRPLVSAYHDRVIDAETVQAEQPAYAAQIAEFLDGRLDSQRVSRILDIGGSTGIVARALADAFDASATVLDPAPLELERAKALGLEVVTGLVEEWDAPPDSFELVLLCQTIDHLLDPRAVLRKIRTLLVDGGSLFVDIVDFRAGIASAGSVQGATKVDHPFAFVEEVAELHLARAGLPVIAKEFAPDGIHVRYLCSAGKPPTRSEFEASFGMAVERDVREAQRQLSVS